MRPAFVRVGLALIAVLAVACGGEDPPSLDLEVGGADTASDIGVVDDVGGSDATADVADTTADVVEDTADAGPDEGGFGWPCDGGDDCDSGYCVPGPDGDRVCTVPCADACPDEAWECAPIENFEGDRVFLCLPIEETTCEPCDDDGDCPNLAASCIDLLDGAFCALPCGTDGACPEGLTCSTESTDDGNRDLCIPSLEVCGDCYDPDDDGYGVGLACRNEGVDCEPDLPLVNPGASELCNGTDDDCDGDTDEDFTFAFDPMHCGGCDIACLPAEGEGACVDGACVVATCDEGFVDCDGDPSNGCERPRDSLNACGGCAALDGERGAPCGTCGSGELACDGADGLLCVGDDGDDALNACNGCEALDGAVGDACGTCDSGGLVCDGIDALACADDLGDDARNACGGCGLLDRELGTSCGTCGSGVVACDGLEGTRCAGDLGELATNVCGGCEPLAGERGVACGTCDSGLSVCDGLEALVCAGDDGDDALNACGGCDDLAGAPGASCGTCGSGTWACDGGDAVTCAGDEGALARNACGGCDDLVGEPGASCGTCGSGTWTCDGDEAVVCGGDEGDDARNACGGCGVLDAMPGAGCGDCGGVVICDGLEAIACFGDGDDSDLDGVCDVDDVCPGFDDGDDADGDDVPDGCDPCPADAADDSDGDGVCDSDDACPGFDDDADFDDDGVADGCDVCPADAADDSDGDGVCDSDDACPGEDDRDDADGDDVPDACDECPLGDDAADADDDTVPDACDACPGGDDRVDPDGDGIPSACDDCPDREVCTLDSCAALRASGVLVDGPQTIDRGSGDEEVWCDMTGGGVTYTGFYFGQYNRAHPGYELMTVASMSDARLRSAFVWFYNRGGGIRNIDGNWNSSNCCFHAGTGGRHMSVPDGSGDNYFYPAEFNGTSWVQACNTGYTADTIYRFRYSYRSNTIFESFAPGFFDGVRSGTACSDNNNPGVWFQRFGP